VLENKCALWAPNNGNLCGIQLTDHRKEEEHLEHHQNCEYVSCVHVNTRLKDLVKKFWTLGLFHYLGLYTPLTAYLYYTYLWLVGTVVDTVYGA
jgi:hypothetical protein